MGHRDGGYGVRHCSCSVRKKAAMDPAPQFSLGLTLVPGFCLMSATPSLEAAKACFVPVAAVRLFRAAFPIRLQEPQRAMCFPHRPLVMSCFCVSLVALGQERL